MLLGLGLEKKQDLANQLMNTTSEIPPYFGRLLAQHQLDTCLTEAESKLQVSLVTGIELSVAKASLQAFSLCQITIERFDQRYLHGHV